MSVIHENRTAALSHEIIDIIFLDGEPGLHTMNRATNFYVTKMLRSQHMSTQIRAFNTSGGAILYLNTENALYLSKFGRKFFLETRWDLCTKTSLVIHPSSHSGRGKLLYTKVKNRNIPPLQKKPKNSNSRQFHIEKSR